MHAEAAMQALAKMYILLLSRHYDFCQHFCQVQQ